MSRAEDRLAEAFLEQQLNALRFSAHQQGLAARQIEALRKRARQILAESDMGTKRGSEAAIAALNRALAEGYDALSAEQKLALQEFAPMQAQAAVKAANAALGADLLKLPNRLSARVDAMLLDGAPSSLWWKAQAESARRGFAREVRNGFVNGDTTDAIARRIIGARGEPGVIDTSLRQARQLVHTSVQTVANRMREEVAEGNADVVKGYIWTSTLDTKACLVCASRDNKRYGLDHRPVGHSLLWNSGPGSIHFGCRCVSSFWLKSMRELGLDIDDFEGSQRASMDGPVSSKTTFEAWIAGKPQAFQDEYFGPGRADMYRKGDLTLADLLSMNGRELSLKQLRAKYQ